MKTPKVVLTGGGTAGHVSLNQALIPFFMDRGYELHYIGSHDGIERELITDSFPEVTYHPISSGKLRRYFSVKNFSDPFKVLSGAMQSLFLLRKLKPEVIFSKGGFVSVPVVMAGKLANIPVVIHESDVTPGLANKLALPFAQHIFTVFEETLEHLPAGKSTCTGAVIRPGLFKGNPRNGLKVGGFDGTKKVILIMGGSQGSVTINDAVRKLLPTLLTEYDVFHLCGKGKLDSSLEGVKGYKQLEYVTTELSDLLSASDIIISRAGSNSIFEFLALKKPMLLIPLSAQQSRGDQILNAKLFKKLGFAEVLMEEELTEQSLEESIAIVQNHSSEFIASMQKAKQPKTPDEMVSLILDYKQL
ncbi:undecaprenyldiphospho-muramoylpentapeptide beta-N-acetylglucosaminyltransferase [Chungangia koreensis]|uniref:UDP-N-acetylglucosamine--N-acetylmuramyl-(pentapeptide) pyrophosphoryl-undecaprenol N-acetylglucosamine transferase n=1 Tax=Chungangia koreensis TaxID=752657 RepID=A0ABV8X7B3_9LACT